MQIKNTMRNHFKPIRMAATEKTVSIDKGIGRKSLIYFWWKYKMVQSLWKQPGSSSNS
jgi:hypothetical protein